MKLRFVLFLALLVAAWLPACAQDLFQSAVVRDPEPINGSAKPASTAVTPDSRGLSGVYEGDAAVITVSGMNEAWEVKCDAGSYGSTTYLSATPFNGERNIGSIKYNCTTEKKKTNNIYNISIQKKNKNLQCGLFANNIIGEYNEQYQDLAFRTNTGYGATMNFNIASPYRPNFGSPLPYLDMSMAMRRSENCVELEGEYVKK